MATDQLLLNNFQKIFRGHDMAHGHHDYGVFTAGTKEKGGKSYTVTDRQVSLQNYTDHIEGRLGLGIIPITRDNKCKFIVADIDIYDSKSEQAVIKAIQERDLPLVVFHSKSKGYHLYLFFSEFIPVKQAKKIMNRFVRLLSIDILCKAEKRDVEIFPKQVVLDSKMTGSWINLPYYNGVSEECRNKMLYENRELELNEAMVIINDRRIYSEKELNEYLDNLEYNEAPPCLQSMFYLNNVINCRNNYLFSFGVYFKKENEDNFEQKLYALNRGLPEPLDEKELDETVIKSIRKKGYGYKCNEAPCIDHCNKTDCKERKYGIGDGKFVSELDFGVMRQIQTDPPWYEWDINGKLIEFKNEDEFLNQNTFRRLCVRNIGYAPYKLKDAEWMQVINGTLANLERIKVDMHEDISPGAMLREYFREFILDRPLASDREQVKIGRVFYEDENNRYFFRHKDLTDFLFNNRGLKGFNHTEIHAFLKKIGCCYSRLRTESGGNLRLHYVPGNYFTDNDIETETEMPEIKFTPEQILEDNQKILDEEEPF